MLAPVMISGAGIGLAPPAVTKAVVGSVPGGEHNHGAAAKHRRANDQMSTFAHVWCVVRYRVLISGRVQGVNFRAAASGCLAIRCHHMIFQHQTSRQYSGKGRRRQRQPTGTGWQPLDGWHIVHLADAGHQRLTALLEHTAQAGGCPRTGGWRRGHPRLRRRSAGPQGTPWSPSPP
jgi:hypothetical protein